jgi:hypothetical protein
MTAWTSDELSKIETAEELRIASLRSDGTLRPPVTIWVVRLDDDLYVRSVRGRAGAWFRGTQARHEGHIRAGGMTKTYRKTPDGDQPGSPRVSGQVQRHGPRILGSV